MLYGTVHRLVSCHCKWSIRPSMPVQCVISKPHPTHTVVSEVRKYHLWYHLLLASFRPPHPSPRSHVQYRKDLLDPSDHPLQPNSIRQQFFPNPEILFAKQNSLLNSSSKSNYSWDKSPGTGVLFPLPKALPQRRSFASACVPQGCSCLPLSGRCAPGEHQIRVAGCSSPCLEHPGAFC